MNRISRLILVLVLLAAFVPAGMASAQSPEVNCATVAAGLGATYKEGDLGGAKYCVIYPPTRQWNRDLVVFAHGYVFADPLDPWKAPDIPWEQAVSADLNLPGILVKLGYAFAISSYHKDGLAVKEGVQDTVALVQYIKETNKKVNRVFVTGASEGGLVTALALQNYPQYFSGGLSTCGPIGDFQKQVDYWGSFRVGFDQLLPPALRYPVPIPGTPMFPNPPYSASTPVFIPPDVMAGWGSETNPGPVGQIVGGYVSMVPSAAIDNLLNATGAAYDPAKPETKLATIAGLLTYNVMATDEARWELAGLPPVPADQLLMQYYGLLAASNTGSPLTYMEPLNGVPTLYPADEAAKQEIAVNYQTSGKLNRQLVVMHTTGDPIVPFWHAKLFTVKAFQTGSIGKLAVIPVVRYGHCAFTPAEAVFAFYTMVIRSTLMPFSDKQIQNALPDHASQAAFKSMLEKNADVVKATK